MAALYAKAQPGHLAAGFGLMHVKHGAAAATQAAKAPPSERAVAMGMQARSAPYRKPETYPFDLGWEPEKELV